MARIVALDKLYNDPSQDLESNILGSRSTAMSPRLTTLSKTYIEDLP